MSRSRRAGVSIWAILAALGPMVLVIKSKRAIGDNSYLWHRVAGDLQAGGGRVLTEDPFSFIDTGRVWRTQSWLADLAYSKLFSVGGLDSSRWIVVVVGSLFFVTSAVLAARWLGARLGFGVWAAMTAVLTLPFMNPRPVIFSYLMLAMVVMALTYRRLHWTLPLIVWIWATLHGSFPLAFVAIGLAALSPVTRTDRRVFVASLVAANLTAHGWGIWEILVNFAAARPALDRIQEWQTPNLVSPLLGWFLIGVILAVTALVSVRDDTDDRAATRGATLTVVAWVVFGLTSNRSIPLAWIALTPFVAAGLARWKPMVALRGIAPAPVIWAAAAALVGLPLLLIPTTPGVMEERFPVEAAVRLTDDRVYHGDATGSWLIHTEWPDRKSYIDDRAELFQDHYVAFVSANAGLPGWEDLFAEHGFTQALVRKDRPIADLLRLSGWITRFEDDTFLVLDRP